MSSLMRPSGPLPARVYWVRRLLVLVIVVLVVAVVWWLLRAHGSSNPAGSTKPDAALSGLGATTSAPSAAPRSSTPPVNPQVSAKPTRHRHVAPYRQHRRLRKAQSPQLPPPTGTCSPADVGIAVSVPDSKVGQTTIATLSLTSLDGAVCTLQITPASMVLRVTSGSDVVWTSDDCPNLLPARQVVVRSDPAALYTWSWDGHRSVQGCVSPGSVAGPGRYEVEAALVGADVHMGAFDITG
jgi:hypothetical protein